MVNWWTLSAVVTEVAGAFLIARGLASETAKQWVTGRGTPRWDFESDADLNYAASSTDAAVGFGVLFLGLVVQGLGALDASARGEFWLLAAPVVVVTLAEIARKARQTKREMEVMRLRINTLVVEGTQQPKSWANIVHGYSRALDGINRGPDNGEDAWAHLDRIYGEGRWLPEAAVDRLRESYETYAPITDREELGDLWLPWFVRRDNPAEPIRDLDRTNARQLQVRDVLDEPAVRPALELEDPPGSGWSHIGRIEHYKQQWRDLPGVSQGPLPAFRTSDGPVLLDGCHRCCMIYAANFAHWSVGLELSDPPADHPDTQPGPRDAALGRVN